MKLSRTYKKIIKETIDNNCLHKFGKQLFGELFGSESDTNLEVTYRKLIKSFTAHEYGQKTPIELVKAMKELKSCISSYPEILKPDGSEVYRGTKIPLKYLIKHVDELGNNKIKYTYKANSVIQSWTSDESVAEDFSGESKKLLDVIKDFNNNFPQMESDDRLLYLRKLIENDILSLPIPVIIKTTSDDDSFLFKSKYFNELSSENDEDELLRIGNNPIETIASVRAEFAEVIKHLAQELARFIHHHNENINTDD